MLARDNDPGLVIGIVLSEVPDGCEDLRRRALCRCEDVTAAPDLTRVSWIKRIYMTSTHLVIQWLGLQRVSGHDAKIIPAPFQCGKQV